MCQRLSSYLTKQHGGDVCLLGGSELFQYSFSRELESISVFHDRRLLGFVEFHLNFGNELTHAFRVVPDPRPIVYLNWA